MKRRHLEDDHARLLATWARYHPLLKTRLFHIPNGGMRGIREAARLKSMGVLAGVPDFFIPLARGKYHGMFLELKAPGGKLTESQAAFLAHADADGYFCVCAVGFDEARAWIEKYLGFQP